MAGMVRFVFLAIALLTVSPALGTDRGEEAGGTLRLILGPAQPGQEDVQGALVVTLKDGFKTYWKRPGDSGVPTVVDFDGSLNLASADFLFPTPSLHELPGDRTVSYKDRVVFPIRARRIDPLAPLTLRVTGMLGMCAEICIPVPIDLTAQSSERIDPSAAAVMFEGANALPREAPSGISVKDVERDDEGRVEAVTIDGPNVRPRPTLFVASDRDRDLVPYARTEDNGPYRFVLDKPAQGPLEAVVSFGGVGARMVIE